MSFTAMQRLHAARRSIVLTIATVGALTVSSAPAFAAEEPRAGWEVIAKTVPTYPRPGGRAGIQIKVFNVGAADSKGTITVTDTLPPGVKAVNAGADGFIGGHIGDNEAEVSVVPNLWECSGNGAGGAVAGATVVTCVNNLKKMPSFAGGGGLAAGPGGFPTPPPGANEELAIGITAPSEEGTIAEPNRVTVVGGGALSPASTSDPVTVSAGQTPFGFAGADAWFTNADGTVDTQAGSHPYEATFVFDMNEVINKEDFPEIQDAGGEPRNLTFSLPSGFVGDPNTVVRCSEVQFNEEACPAASQVGIMNAEAPGENYFGSRAGFESSPVFNLVPPAGQPAEFGFQVLEINTKIGTSVRSGSDYGLTSIANNIPQRDVIDSTVTLWGEPGDPSHKAHRVGHPAEAEGVPFLTLPTSCEGPQSFTLTVNEWEHPDVVAHTSFQTHNADHEPTGFTGCETLSFGTSLTTAPDTSNADSPAGLSVEVRPQLGGLLAPEGLGTADIKNTTVTLPEGVVINPGQAAGLKACQAGEDGLTTQTEREAGEENNGPAHCPNASKVGTDEIETPLLEHSLKGSVYVLQSNPPELKLLVTASGEGVNLKLVGVVHLNEQTGRLTTTFTETPGLPFTAFKLSFSGGAQAALDTPTQCGTYGTVSDFTPWSAPLTPDAFPTASFSLTAGPEGGSCPSNPLPFSPSLTAGASTDQAGGFTDFSMLLARGDGQQRIERLQFRAPAGLGGMLSTVPLCGEPQAAQGTCSSVSRIGHASVASGPGPYPLVLPQPGEPELPIYLTGPYGGAPFGLSIVTPVLAGPFNLGTIVTRAKIEIDPHTAQVTVTTDPLPQVVAGVPTDLRLVDAVIDRPGFMFNPTNCDPSSFSGTAWGTPPAGVGGPGASASIGSHFQVGSCRGLEFHPKFSVSASGRNSKANGASLTARVSYPSAAQGTQANIGLVKVELPKQLPSRLTTLQKACTLVQFEANPAGCPPASFIGHAVVHTPELPVPLTGPAIFVSHGGEAFPTLTMVLQGDGVTIDLVGSTFIDKAGITSTTFKTVPDAPFSTFELTLPQGPSSALATNVPAKANYSLCGQKLTMPTEFVGQNGAVLNQTTPVNVTGCAKTKTLTRAQKLAAALKACHKKKARARRVSCERQARQRYGAVKKKKKKK
jgi:hypothetical protein